MTKSSPGVAEIAAAATSLELHDLQSGILHPRPSPYVGTYLVFRVDERRDGRTFIGRLQRAVASAAEKVWTPAATPCFLQVARTCRIA